MKSEKKVNHFEVIYYYSKGSLSSPNALYYKDKSFNPPMIADICNVIFIARQKSKGCVLYKCSNDDGQIEDFLFFQVT